MGEHREQHAIFGPFPDLDPIDTALLFLRTNRYSILTRAQGTRPAELLHDPSLIPSPSAHTEDAAADVETPNDSDQDGEELAATDDESGDDGDESDDGDDGDNDVATADKVSDADEPDSSEDASAEDGEPPADAEICVKATLTRGEKWSGFLGSNMADLPTHVELKLDGNIIKVEYVVTTTGQLLSAEEREFWKREAQALEQYVKGSGELVSLASVESDRASTARRERLSTGLWIAAIVFVVVFVAGIMIARM